MKKKTPNYQYNKAQYHPVEEYLVTSTEKLTSDTPSFVLEVTWPRVALFYHPASSLCLQLRDRYVSVAREIRRRSIRAPVEFWAISCEVHRDACEDLEVTSVPRILAYPKGKIEGQLVPRTANNDIEVEKLIQIVGVDLRDVDEDEVRRREEMQQDAMKLREIEEHAKAANDPFRMHIEDGDHMQEILHPHSALSDVYADAMTSLLNSIDGATKKDSKGYIIPWSWNQYHAFREWLDLMHWALPTRDMAKVHNIINDLRNNIEEIESRPDLISSILSSHDYYKTNPKWSASCRDGNMADQGYACGFWKLLHIVSIGVVEQHHTVMGDLQRVMIPHVTATIRDYVEFFGFAKSKDGNEVIRRSFEQCVSDDGCQARMGLKKKGFFAKFRRRIIPARTEKSWRELAVFLWTAHQEYRHHKLSISRNSVPDTVDLQWPPSSLCPLCYSNQEMSQVESDGTFQHYGENQIVDPLNQIVWNKNKVFDHLKHEYWPRTLQTPRVVVIDRWDENPLNDIVHAGGGSTLITIERLLFLVAIGGLLWFIVNRPKSIRFQGKRNRTTYQYGRRTREFGDDESVSSGRHQPILPRLRYRPGSGPSPFLDN